VKPTALPCALLLFLSLLVPCLAHAQLFRSYIASYGNDANPCTVVQPCRLLPAAINATAAGGEVWMLDSANFNSATVTIDKDVNIAAVPGQVGSIVAVASAPAIIIDPGRAVSLKNVSIGRNPINPGSDGIRMTTGVLAIQDSVFSTVPGATSILLNGTGTLSVHNSVFRDSYMGVYVAGGGRADISSSKFFNVYWSIYADGTASGATSSISVRDCTVMGPGGAGPYAVAQTAGAFASVTVHNTSVSNMSYGMAAYGQAAYLGVSNSAISRADYGLMQSGGAVLESLGNNLVRNNKAANTYGTITIVPAS
jgi:hypothetical protein